MPNWHEILNELKRSGSTHDIVRRKYLHRLQRHTKRNAIVYYSGWLQKVGPDIFSLNDADKNGFMTVVHKLDRTKGLDLILHTPGGEIAATESLVDYLRSMFGTDIRAIVPQLAMSAGTMVACACKEIVMGQHSSLGPIDPQYMGVPAHGIVEEFTRAFTEIKNDKMKMAVWQPIIGQYRPTLIGECEKAIKWAEKLVVEWLGSGMLAGVANKKTVIDTILKELGDHSLNLSHSRHLSAKKCSDMGLKVTALETDRTLQDAVLSIHHACIHTLAMTPAIKIIENQRGVGFISSVRVN